MKQTGSKMTLAGLVAIYLAVLAVLVVLAPWGSLEYYKYGRYSMFMFAPEVAVQLQDYPDNPHPQQILDYYFSEDFGHFIETIFADQNDLAFYMTALYYAHILHDNPELSAPFMERIVAENGEQTAFLGASIVVASETPDSEELFEKWLTRFVPLPEERPQVREDFAEIRFDCPSIASNSNEELDVLWACYFASGQSDYLREITKPLKYHSGDQDEVEARLTRFGQRFETGEFAEDSAEFASMMELARAYSAWFSLYSNARDYAHVMNVLRVIHPQLEGKIAENLSAITESAE